VAQLGRFDHVDFRVRDVKKVRRFYDALMPALGFTRISKGDRSRGYYNEDPREPFFWVVRSVKHVPGLGRIAFAASSRDEVDRVARVVRRAGGKEIAGPEKIYTQPYYAVFFEDPEGNRFEVCCRR